MSDMDEMRIRIDAQERLILTLRAKLAEAEKRCAQKEAHILRQERRFAIKRSASSIERIFGDPQ